MNAIKELKERLEEEVENQLAGPPNPAKKPAGRMNRLLNSFGWN
jgi:hypothetical protein